MAAWASLRRDLLDSIFDKLVPSVVDSIKLVPSVMDSILEDCCMSFSAVCSEWRSVACEKLEQLRTNHKRHCPQHQHVPLLAVPIIDDWERRSFYDIITRKNLGQFQLRIPFHIACCGSSHGWLILLNHYSFEVTLSNPFSGKVIYLPDLSPNKPIFSFPFLRGALSTDPDMNGNECMLMLIYGDYPRRLAFIRSGDKDWSYIETDEHAHARDLTHIGKYLFGLSDVIYNDGLFYVIDNRGMLLSCDVSSSNFKVRRVTPPDNLHIDPHRIDPYSTTSIMHTTYIVESPRGDLLRVVKTLTIPLTRTGCSRTTMTIGFVIYKLACYRGIPRWTEVKSLGNVALFLGHNYSISVTASDFVGCQSNSIYFSGHFPDFQMFGGNFDGVFNLHDGTMTPLHLHWEWSELESERLERPMFWILPPLCEAT